MLFTKKELLQTLDNINKQQQLDVECYIDDVLQNDIPIDALRFINKHKPLKDLGVFNLIYSKRRKTPLYKNFKKGNIDDYEQAVCLGSLMTQMLCYIKTTHDDVVKHSQLIGMNTIMHALYDFSNTGSFTSINKAYNQLSQLFKELFDFEGDEINGDAN